MTKLMDRLDGVEVEPLGIMDFVWFGYRAGRPRKNSPKTVLRRLGKDLVVLGLDVGKTTGYALLTDDGLELGHFTSDTPALSIKEFIKSVYQVYCRRRFVVIIEGGYCPAYLPIFLSGVAYGVATDIAEEVVVISPHRKPPNRKEKLPKRRVELLMEDLKRDFDVGGIELGYRYGHSASAYGLVEVWLYGNATIRGDIGTGLEEEASTDGC